MMDRRQAWWPQQLAEGLAQMGIAADEGQRVKLLAYLALLDKWNQAYNLTAVRDPEFMVSRQLLDSLSILPWVQGPQVLDVGAGAGLPGIPLAIMMPSTQFSLLDSNGKKTRFMQQARLELGLENIAVTQSRVEGYRPPALFNTIVSRAFASLSDMLAGSTHLLLEGGQWLAMKGQLPQEELHALPAWAQYRVEELRVPGESGQRHLIIIQRA